MREIMILGATGGIGEAIVDRMAQPGNRLWLHFHKNADKKSKISADLKAKGIAFEWFQADLGDPDAVEQLFLDFDRRAAGLDVLINASGASEQCLFQWMQPEAWENLRRANLDSVVYSTQAAVSRMFDARQGAIVLVSSVWGETGGAMEVHYSCLKAAVNGLVKALAKELGPSGIRVNAVAPGWIETPMNSHLSADDREAFESEIPLGRIGRPEEVADCVYFLASESASYVTGQILGMNGGYYI